VESELRSMIREVLAQELARLRADLAGGGRGAPAPRVREERVRIDGDADLAAFVHRLMELSRDGEARREIEQGRWVFRLSRDAPPTATGEDRRLASPARPQARTTEIERGVLSERQVDALPEGTTRLLVGKAVRFTPLARDRLRQRGIEIERKG